MSTPIVDPEFKALIPPLTAEELAGLEASIKAAGKATEPLKTWNGILLDGHNRLEICTRLKLPYCTEDITKTFNINDRAAALVWAIEWQLNRRNLAPYDRTRLVLKREDIFAAKAKANQRASGGDKKSISVSVHQKSDEPITQQVRPVTTVKIPGKPPVSPTYNSGATARDLLAANNKQKVVTAPISTLKEVAKAAGVSHDTVAKVKVIEAMATPEVKARLSRGETTIHKEYKAIVQGDKKQIRAGREAALAEATVKANQALVNTNKVYNVIYADPEWRFEPYSRETGMDRAADNHYQTSDLDKIKARKVPAAKDCVLFLWATVPMLPQALEVMTAWGFTYKSNYVWVKDKIGTGYWGRNKHELLLIGTKGNVPAPAMGDQPASAIEAKVGRHSEKPEEFAKIIEKLFPTVPKLEMNARGPRKGWDVWGNEAEG